MVREKTVHIKMKERIAESTKIFNEAMSKNPEANTLGVITAPYTAILGVTRSIQGADSEGIILLGISSLLAASVVNSIVGEVRDLIKARKGEPNVQL